MSDEFTEEANEMVDMLLKDDKLIAGVAKLSMKIHKELIKAGFTEEQAIQITANTKLT